LESYTRAEDLDEGVHHTRLASMDSHRHVAWVVVGETEKKGAHGGPSQHLGHLLRPKEAMRHRDTCWAHVQPICL
jgi:hypothetical protein